MNSMVFVLRKITAKYIIDTIFFTLQTKKNRSTVIGIGAILVELETIKMRADEFRAYEINPLTGTKLWSVMELQSTKYHHTVW